MARERLSITSKLRERFFLSTKTYKHMRFSMCGFLEYAKDLLRHPSGGIKYVTPGHCNTSALESRFSIAKRSGLNDTAKYHHLAANLNTLVTLKHKRREEESTAWKMKKGNTSYPGELIAPERPEAARHDFTIGKMIERRKNKVDCCFDEWKQLQLNSTRKTSAIGTILATPMLRPPNPIICKFLLPKLQAQRIKEGTLVEMLRTDESINDLMILTVESPEHWETMNMLFSEPGAIRLEHECRYLLQLAFELLDEAAAAAKLSHKASFWWQVMNSMRDQRLHANSPNQAISNHIRAYLFQFLSGRLLSWSREVIEGKEQEPSSGMGHIRNHVLPGTQIDYATVGTDINTFVGFSLFSLKKKYGSIEELPSGDEAEDKFLLLTDMIATEEDITENSEYVSKYYDSYYMLLNRGDMTLVSPRYAHLFHGIIYQIALSLNVKKMVEEKNEQFMEKAREKVDKNLLPAWSKTLQNLAEGIHLANQEKVCHELLSEIVGKVFNCKGSAMLKRYYSIYLARGGKEASQSSLRDSRKQEGLGKKKKSEKKKKANSQSTSS